MKKHEYNYNIDISGEFAKLPNLKYIKVVRIGKKGCYRCYNEFIAKIVFEEIDKCPVCDENFYEVMVDSSENNYFYVCPSCEESYLSFDKLISNSKFSGVNPSNMDEVYDNLASIGKMNETDLVDIFGNKKGKLLWKKHLKELDRIEKLKKKNAEYNEKLTLKYKKSNQNLYSEEPLGHAPKQRKRGFWS